jgi:hypothetical protein
LLAAGAYKLSLASRQVHELDFGFAGNHAAAAVVCMTAMQEA